MNHWQKQNGCLQSGPKIKLAFICVCCWAPVMSHDLIQLSTVSAVCTSNDVMMKLTRVQSSSNLVSYYITPLHSNFGSAPFFFPPALQRQLTSLNLWWLEEGAVGTVLFLRGETLCCVLPTLPRRWFFISAIFFFRVFNVNVRGRGRGCSGVKDCIWSLDHSVL